ncbi:DoxX family protein [bacterium]|nr:DoxX family protein [bacterium]
MKLNRPVGNALYAPLFLRQALGWYLILSGIVKLENLKGFIGEFQKLNVLPEHFATVYAIILPYGEILAGGLLVLGFLTTLGAFLAAFHGVTLIYAFGLFSSTGQLLSKDLIFLAAALSVLYSGAGAFSVDRFRETG